MSQNKWIGLYAALALTMVGCGGELRDACRDAGGIPTDDGLLCLMPANSLQQTPWSEVRLRDGRILVCGANGTAECSIVGEDRGLGVPAASMSGVRSLGSGILLPDGRVLVSGGTDETGIPRDDAEIYDPAADRWMPVASRMSAGRAGHVSRLTLEGDVHIEGGTFPRVAPELFRLEELTFETVAEHTRAGVG